MFKDPDLFIQDKLTKKYLSINTIRDGVIAAFLIALLKRELRKTPGFHQEQWMSEQGKELRQRTSEAFASIDAPFEYPSLSQLQAVTDILKKAFHWHELTDVEKATFDTTCQSLYSKFDDG